MSNDNNEQIRNEWQSVKESLDRIESDQKRIAQQLSKKHKFELFNQEDENTVRGNWSGKFDFFLSCLGYAVGFGNIWRFPFLAYRHGGGAFLIPYLLFLVLVGLPIFLLELSLGQFTSCGPLTCWNYAPLFKGLGIGSLMVAFYYCIYYNVLIAWSFWYLFASFQSPLPWTSCGNWSSMWCRDKVSECNSSNTDEIRFSNGTCSGMLSSNASYYGIYNATAAGSAGIKSVIPAQDYLDYVSLRDRLANFENLGPVRSDMALALLLAWVVVFLCLIKGIKSSGKVVYFTAIFPYLMLVILFINMLTLQGSSQGISFFITPDLSKLASAEPWKDAAVQIFFTLSASEGGLITLSSYNRFHNNVVRDSLLIPLCNCLTSMLAGFTVFGYIGYLAALTDSPVDSLASSGTSLAFIVYPQALTSLPVPVLWSILFFLMMITLGIDSQFALVEALITSITDQWSLHKFKTLIIFCFCCVAYVLGLTMTTNGGTYMLTLLDTYAGGFNVMFISILECLSIAYLYGARRFTLDIEVMAGSTQLMCIPWRIMRWWWIVCWGFITPAFVAVIFVFSFIDYPTLSHAGYSFPAWAEVLGWLMTSSVVLAIILTAFLRWLWPVVFQSQHPMATLRRLLRPSDSWGPALAANRRKVTHAQLVIKEEGVDGTAQQEHQDAKINSAYFASDQKLTAAPVPVPIPSPVVAVGATAAAEPVPTHYSSVDRGCEPIDADADWAD